jgi:hypothetical protein
MRWYAARFVHEDDLLTPTQGAFEINPPIFSLSSPLPYVETVTASRAMTEALESWINLRELFESAGWIEDMPF